MRIPVVLALFLALVWIVSFQITQSLGLTESFTVQSPQVLLSEGGMMNEYSLKQHRLHVSIMIESFSNATREYEVLIEIRKLPEGITSFLFAVPEKTDYGEEEHIYVAWIPNEAGDFEVRTFLISDFDNPQILSPVLTSHTSIYDDSFKGWIKMQKLPCDGECPAYYVEVYDNHTAIFAGGDYLAKPGRYVFEISQDQADQLLDEFLQASFFSLDDSFPFYGEGAPSVVITINIAGTTKHVTHQYFDVPENLLELEKRIDEILGTKKWVYGE